MGTRGDREGRGATGAEALERTYSSAPPASAGAEGRISEEVTTSRPTLTEAPSHWLDRLIIVSHELPYSDGAEAVMRALVEALGAIVPDCAIGIRMPAKDGADRKELRSEPPSGEQRICADTTRMFPELGHERSVALPGDLSTGALHFACGDGAIDDPRAPIVQFMHRVALVTGGALERARALEHASTLQTELRTLKMHMVQAEKLASLGQIAAGMVHELNNPLTSIVAYTDYLLRRARQSNADPDDSERLRRIAESAHRMLRFTRDLVSYARPSSEVPVPVSLHTVIQQALAFCEHELSVADVTVECKFDSGVSGVRGMPEQLAQIFVNLVTNACHAMTRENVGPPSAATLGDGGGAPSSSVPSTQSSPATPSSQGGGRLTISTELVHASSRVRIVVADTGHGITQAHLPLVFAPFFTTKGAGRGTGLGLSIVKNIVESHHGTIHAESEPPNGTRFIVILPAGG